MSGLDDACCRLPRVRRSTDQPNVCWPGTRTKYVYDGNGNVTSRQGSSITWTSYNYPNTVSDTATGETVSFAYQPDRRAWYEATQSSSGTEHAYHVGDLLDIVSSGSVTDYRHYIYAGSEPIAIDSRKSNGTNAFYYLLSDQQGSISKITNSSGAIVVGESFTAYGSRRNPTTWSGAPSGSDLATIAGISRHGYTFQDALGQMNLNNMVGRVEDAVTGRFLSPDPYIPHVADPQSYNRYSYVDNNPITDIDPSGFDDYPTVPDLGQVTVTGTYENFGAGGLGDLGTGFGGLNGTTASPADLNGVRVEARLDAHAAAQAARKGKASAGKPDSGDSEGGQSPQTNSPPSNSQQPAQPTAPLPSGPPESASPPGNPCGCGDNGQSAVDAWDNAQTRLNDAADAWARGDLSQYEQDMNLALQDLMQYYKFLGQPLNPSDYGWQNGQ